ncbi:MAG: CHASE3 domain-containing protein [Pirellulaceae bacterium]
MNQAAERPSATFVGRRAGMGYTLAVFLFAGCALVAVMSSQSVRRYGSEASGIVEFLGSLRTTYSLLQELESGQRGFVITGRPEYLEPYQQAAARLPKALADLRKRAARHAIPQEWMREFEGLVQERREELERAVQLVQAGDHDGAEAYVARDTGHRLMEAVRDTTEARQRVELSRLRVVRDHIVTALERTAALGVLAAVLGIGIVATSFWQLRRELFARQALADDLYQQREQLRVAMLREVTEQQRAQVQRAEEQRRKDEFLAMLGHELRNPLAGILTGVQVLRMLRPEGDAAKMQEVIERQAKHMSRMVDDLLDISRFARGKLTLKREQLDLRELMQLTVDDYRSAQLQGSCRLSLHLPDVEVWVHGDRTRLAQAVSNLIHNACKFSEGSGSIDIALQLDPTSPSALIIVRDHGIGMSERTLANVFQPFMQADTSAERSRGGLGLGLALVDALVRLHDGEVRAHSEGLGQGSQFTIRLPLSVPARPMPLPRPGATVEDGQLNSQRVLIIDDRRDAVIPLEKMLRMDGHEVKTSTTGEQGLEIAQSFHPTIVLCDIGLADGMNGYDVARSMRGQRELQSVYMVAITGYGHDDDRQRASAAGFDFHLTKPVGKQELDRLIAERPRFPTPGL